MQEEGYIDDSNVDDYIDKMMGTVKNYEFAVDLEGNKYDDTVDDSPTLEYLETQHRKVESQV